MVGAFLGVILVIVYLALIIYLIMLAARFVGAVERIASSSERFVSHERQRGNEPGVPPVNPQL